MLRRRPGYAIVGYMRWMRHAHPGMRVLPNTRPAVCACQGCIHATEHPVSQTAYWCICIHSPFMLALIILIESIIILQPKPAQVNSPALAVWLFIVGYQLTVSWRRRGGCKRAGHVSRAALRRNSPLPCFTGVQAKSTRAESALCDVRKREGSNAPTVRAYVCTLGFTSPPTPVPLPAVRPPAGNPRSPRRAAR